MLLAHDVKLNAPAPFDIQRRAHSRLTYTEPCLFQTDKRAFNAVAINISEGGICVRVQGLGFVNRGTVVALMLENFAPIDAVVRWTKDRVVGFQFTTSLEDHVQLAALINRLSGSKPGLVDDAEPEQSEEEAMDEIAAAYERWDLSDPSA